MRPQVKILKTAQLLRSLFTILNTLVAQSIQFLRLALSSRAGLSAEVLFLRKQLAFYQEHQVLPRRPTDAARTSGQEREAAELSLKLGIRVSPRTVRAYWPSGCDPVRKRTGSQRWGTFVRNHCTVDCGLRFSGIDYGQLSSALCPGCDGSGKPSDSTF